MAQAILTLIPSYVQVVVDNSAGTATVQVWNSSTSAWDTVQTLTISSEEFSFAKLLTAASGLTVSGGNATAPAFNASQSVNSVAGTTAGTIYWTMPFQGTAYKKCIVYLSGYENDTTTAQTITFPTAFTDTPYIAANTASVPGVSVSTTALSINPDSTSTYTGWIVVEGF